MPAFTRAGTTWDGGGGNTNFTTGADWTDSVAAGAYRTVAAANKALQRIRRGLEECIDRAERERLEALL